MSGGLLLRHVTLHGRRLSPVVGDPPGPGLLHADTDVERVVSLCLEQLANCGGPIRLVDEEVAPVPVPVPAAVHVVDKAGDKAEHKAGEKAGEKAVVPAPAMPTTEVGTEVATIVPARPSPDVQPEHVVSDASREAPAGDDGRADGSALDRLQLLSKLLLEMDSGATMDVTAAGEHAYELHAISLHGSTLSSGFGTITDQTNVRRIAEVCRKATDRGS